LEKKEWKKRSNIAAQKTKKVAEKGKKKK